MFLVRLWISASNLANFWPEFLLKKNFLKYLVRFLEAVNIPGSIELFFNLFFPFTFKPSVFLSSYFQPKSISLLWLNCGHMKLPQRWWKDIVLPWSRPTCKDNQKKKRLGQVPWELATVSRTLAINGVQPTFLSGHILRGPNLMVELPVHVSNDLCAPTGRKPSQVLSTQNEKQTGK